MLHRSMTAVIALAPLLGAAVPAAMAAQASDASVRINQIQVIGSHNSYHAGLLPGIGKLLAEKNPEVFRELDYSHPSLEVQLDHGVRQIELDIYADSKGGLYAHPFGPKMVADAGLPADPAPYSHGEMLQPGFKVMHVQDIDYVSNCQPFVACLRVVRQWSQSHPGHAPIFILVETEQDVPDDKLPWTRPEAFTPQVFDSLDAEIRSVFSWDELITPDQVRGSYATLNEAILQHGWPTLREARGKVIFLMDQKPVGPVYLQGHAGLRGRVLFTNSDPGAPDAAFVEQNESSAEQIDTLVRQGYLVRTRSDADTVEARTNDTRRRDEVMQSGAQVISSDYPPGEPSRWTKYSVVFPGDVVVRCNPVNAPAGCVDSELEGHR
ncbi:phosphatidylinositol-specific phospholipase C1-like protein [Silvibacterium sp.]|uniref:phosphatidylinositol-specific phospholipase C1-like protein n=1 Tax=Silvibacterium sp. TaxID=1964179 RepID=UPI0039E4F6B9